MKEDTFFSQILCDRCHKPLNVRTMSWFNDETIFMDCSAREDQIKRKLQDPGKYEGCGYIPEV
jgi:hypothetical protein